MKQLLLIAGGLLAAASPAAAQDLKGVWFAGGTVSRDSSGYLGAVRALPGAALGRGLAVRGVVSAGAYSYEGGVGRVDATWEGADLALVQQASGAWGWANVSLGADLKHTRLKPPDPANDQQGTKVDVAFQTDGARLAGPWRLGWIGSYAVRAEEYSGRVQVSRDVTASGLRIGAEAGLQGDPNYRRTSGGLIAARPWKGGYELQVAAGATRLRGVRTSPYVSLGLSRTF